MCTRQHSPLPYIRLHAAYLVVSSCVYKLNKHKSQCLLQMYTRRHSYTEILMNAWDCLKESFNICSEQTDMMISALSLLLLLHSENKVNFSVYHHIYYLVTVISRLLKKIFSPFLWLWVIMTIRNLVPQVIEILDFWNPKLEAQSVSKHFTTNCCIRAACHWGNQLVALPILEAQISLVNGLSVFSGWVFLTFLLTMTHRFPIWFRSGRLTD